MPALCGNLISMDHQWSSWMQCCDASAGGKQRQWASRHHPPWLAHESSRLAGFVLLMFVWFSVLCLLFCCPLLLRSLDTNKHHVCVWFVCFVCLVCPIGNKQLDISNMFVVLCFVCLLCSINKQLGIFKTWTLEHLTTLSREKMIPIGSGCPLLLLSSDTNKHRVRVSCVLCVWFAPLEQTTWYLEYVCCAVFCVFVLFH